MNFACSNIAWTYNQEPDCLKFLQDNNIKGIEVAPTVVWPNWENANSNTAKIYKNHLIELGFEIPAMQSILYGKTFNSIFDKTDQEKIIEHLKLVAELAYELNAKSIVFGNPKLRKTKLNFNDSVNEVYSFFSRAAELFSSIDSCLCIEPCHQSLDCDFVTNTAEALTLVKYIDHSGFRLHIDAGSLFLAGETLDDCWNEVQEYTNHYHISQPNLVDFSDTQVPHENNLSFLNKNSYDKWCSVEMKNSEIPFSSRGPWNIIAKFA